MRCDEAVFRQQHRPRHASGEDGQGQQGAAGEVGEVEVAGDAVVAGGIAHHQRLTQPLGVAQHRHRHRVGVPATADRDGVTAGCGQQLVVLIVAAQQQAHTGGAGHRAGHLDDAGVQAFDAGLGAECLRGRQDAEQVERAGGDRRPLVANIGGLIAAVDGDRVGSGSQGG